MLTDITTDQKQVSDAQTHDHFFSSENERNNQALAPEVLSNITTDQLISPIISLNTVKPIEVVDQLSTSGEEPPLHVEPTGKSELIKG
jgi:hypothetical protein